MELLGDGIFESHHSLAHGLRLRWRPMENRACHHRADSADREGTQQAFLGDASSRTARPRGWLKACRRRQAQEGRKGVLLMMV